MDRDWKKFSNDEFNMEIIKFLDEVIVKIEDLQIEIVERLEKEDQTT